MDHADGNEVEEVDLAVARLEWVRDSRCLDLPSQREALAWHVARCGEALSTLDHMPLDRVPPDCASPDGDDS